MAKSSIIVDEHDENNVVTSFYVPLLVDVVTRYIDNDGQELVSNKKEQVQVGESFNAAILENVTDATGKVWEYSKIKVASHKVVDGENKVNIKYVPMISSVANVFVDTTQTKIIDDKVEEMQVGSIYPAKVEKRVIDKEGKYWIFRKTSKDNIKINKNKEENAIIYTYDKDQQLLTIYNTEPTKENKSNNSYQLVYMLSLKFDIE